MQGGVGDDDAADRDGLELGDRGQRAGASDLDLDRLEHGRRPLGRELVRHGPARAARDEAEPLLEGEIVDLVDHAVDVVAEARALSLDLAVTGEHLRRRAAEFRQRVGRQAEALHGVDGAELRRREAFADLAPGVGEEGERARGGDGGVELAQRAGGEVAGIGVDRLAGLGLTGVERGEIRLAHENLAARLEDSRRAVQAVRDDGDRAHVGGHVLALEAVAARRRLDELAVLVAQAARKPVDLRLGGHGEGGALRHAQKAAHAGAELLDLLVGENVAEREHRHGVADFGEFLRRRRADLAVHRLRVGEFREGLLERGVAAAQLVVFGVRNGRRVLAVIAPVVLGDLGAEPRVFGARHGEGLTGLLRHRARG